MNLTAIQTKRAAWRAAMTATVFGMVLSTVAPALAVPTDVSLELGDSRVDETSTYVLDMSTVDTGTSLQCIEIDLGANADGSGAVSGLDTSSSTFDASDIVTFGSWSVDNTASAAHQLRITNGTGENPSATGSITWGGVTNGDTAETTYYAVMTTYTDTGCSTANETTTVAFVYTNGQAVSVTVDPTLSFDIQPVASSTAVAGTTTTATTTDGTVPFGSVTSSSNGVAAHDLQVATNASSGYNVYLRYTQALTNGSGDTIDDHTGTYASPSAFPAAGTEAFGFHTDDTDVAGFGASNFAAFKTSNEIVMSRTTATPSAETNTVAYQVGISNTTESGTYNSTLIYTAVATY
ncbi:TPA: hypothetical protein EYO12_03950 [Candidatus Saccharibacteria bacterium]|nr:hypothetical protein [Candidatus Saccharibacteria bacterium]HIO87812.1 hypothetical protein [Candidatus Saccharibacteria bacterium]